MSPPQGTLDSLDAVATAALVRAGEVSVLEVVQAAIKRLQTRNPALNAIIDSWEDEALAYAQSGVPMGLLAGVPMLLKDTVEYPGRRFARGSRLNLDVLGRNTDPWVAAMQAQGAVFIGKTNTPEFGLLDVTEPLAFGPTLNPWRADLSSGGSSGGSAAAVAARITPMAHGSDGGGSIRYPAACCGVFGFKPTLGRTTTAQAEFDPRLQSVVASHVLSLSVRDSALAFSIAESARRGLACNLSTPWQPAPLKRPLKIALITRPLHGGALASAFQAATEQAADLLRRLGHQVVPCDWPFDASAVHQAFFDRWAYSVHREFASLPEPQYQRMLETVEPWTVGLAREGATFNAQQVEAMVQNCLMASNKMRQFHHEWDILMTPISAEHAVLLGQHAPDLDYATLHQRVSHNVAFTPLQNLCGQPGMSVPLCWSPDGLPIGLHFASAAHGDELLFQLATQLEAAQAWALRLPPTLTQGPL
jgi:amidase